MNLAEDLKARGYGKEVSAPLETILGAKRSVYLGIDPTADSLHLGHLVPIILMRRLAKEGHRTVFLIGGGTAMIGDPRESGERKLLDKRTLEHNKRGIRAQLQKIVGRRIELVDNASWLFKVPLVEFLREVGKHFTVNEMIKRDVIKRRLAPDDSISYTEFAYSLLQGYDFFMLFKKKGVTVQVGGSDQWTNLLSGVELVRRKLGEEAYCFTTPLITDARGKKLGKSEGNAVWLDPKKTSLFAFYQYWINVPDTGLETYLKIYTDLSLSEISTLMELHTRNPAKRAAQKVLADEVTKIVHGEKGMLQAQQETAAQFGGASVDTLSEQQKSVFPQITAGTDKTVVTLASEGFGISKSEARRLIAGKGIRLNDAVVAEDRTLIDADFRNGIALLEKGKTKILVKR
ncbi:tyrosine--tRNA ligase [Candidatus Parcubacteria bacterium]|nr:tyrosine--tRNA ligase [Candidatus Parcubacteria bacterium]